MEKSDEFYSTKEFVEKCMSQIKPDTFKNKVVYMFCDSEESEFVKYFKAHPEIGYKELLYSSNDLYTNSELFQKADILFTNPPFLNQNKLFKFISKFNKEWILMNTVCGAQSQIYNLLRTNIQRYYSAPSFSESIWKNITKEIPIVQFSNIDCFYKDTEYGLEYWRDVKLNGKTIKQFKYTKSGTDKPAGDFLITIHNMMKTDFEIIPKEIVFLSNGSRCAICQL